MAEQPQWLADLQRQSERMLEQSQQAQAELAQLSETATSPDRAVSVTVGANGALKGLELDERVMRGRTAASLSATIMQLAGQAQAAAARRAIAVVEPFAGNTGMEFLRSQLPPEEAGDSSPAATRDGEDDDEPPQTFLRPAH